MTRLPCHHLQPRLRCHTRRVRTRSGPVQVLAVDLTRTGTARTANARADQTSSVEGLALCSPICTIAPPLLTDTSVSCSKPVVALLYTNLARGAATGREPAHFSVGGVRAATSRVGQEGPRSNVEPPLTYHLKVHARARAPLAPSRAPLAPSRA